MLFRSDAALVRDVVIELSWTGDADIDVLVEEPPGTVCSLASPRSTSGGTLLGDEAQAANSSPTHRERYIATEAFPGTYKILVRKAWGKVAADPAGKGFPEVGEPSMELTRIGLSHFREGLRLLGMAVAESPEVQARQRARSAT